MRDELPDELVEDFVIGGKDDREVMKILAMIERNNQARHKEILSAMSNLQDTIDAFAAGDEKSLSTIKDYIAAQSAKLTAALDPSAVNLVHVQQVNTDLANLAASLGAPAPAAPASVPADAGVSTPSSAVSPAPADSSVAPVGPVADPAGVAPGVPTAPADAAPAPAQPVPDAAPVPAQPVPDSAVAVPPPDAAPGTPAPGTGV